MKIPNNTVRLDAFNLWPGATIVTDPNPYFGLPEEVMDEIDPEADEVWCITHVERDPITEKVHVWARRCDLDTYVIRTSFTFGYCDKVHLVGNIVNFNDVEDNNWGS